MNRALLIALLFSSLIGFTQTSNSEKPRYITHVTRADGVFTTALIFNNSASSEKTVIIRPFSEDGTPLHDGLEVTVAGKAIEERSSLNLLPEETSHLTISGSRRVLVSVRYDNTTGNQGLATHLHESNFTQERYHIYPGAPHGGQHWEGAAIVNLVPPSADPFLFDDAEVKIHLRRRDHSLIRTHQFDLGLSAKALKVFGPLFPETASMEHKDFFYEIESIVPLGVTALMGNFATNDIASALPAPPLEADPVVIRSLNQIPSQAYTLITAELDDDLLSVKATFDPSCRFNLSLFWDGSFRESEPVMVNVRLGLTGSGPVCLDTLFEQEKEFDLGMILNAAKEAYSVDQAIILNLYQENGNIFKTFQLQ